MIPARKGRGRALAALLGLALGTAAFQAAPLSIPYLASRNWFKSARAAIRGARFAGDAGIVLQASGNDCGAACLKMILKDCGIDRSLPSLTLELETSARGTSMRNLRMAAGRMGIPARFWRMGATDLSRAPLPAIAFVNRDHFVVVRRILLPGLLEIDDPALGRLQWPIRNFRRHWSGETLVFDAKWTPPGAPIQTASGRR